MPARAPMFLVVITCLCFLTVPFLAAQEAVPSAGSFQALWSVKGTSEGLEMGVRDTSIFRHTGRITMLGDRGRVGNTLSKCIGFSDTRTGLTSRCVWVNERGESIYSEMHSDPGGRPETGRGVGTFVGGTGRFAGIEGSYELEWVNELTADPTRIEARTVRMTGRYRLAPGVGAR